MMGQRWENQQIYSTRVWLSSSRTWLHVYILIYCNTAVRSLANAYVWLLRTRGEGGCVGGILCISMYNICVMHSMVMYSIARKYPRMLVLQVKYYMARSYHIGLTSQKLSERRDSRNINNNAIKLTCFGTCLKPWIRFHPCWLIIYSKV